MKMVEKKTWKEFRETKLLWWVNRILHTFGWVICITVNADGTINEKESYPARVKYRGFNVEDEEAGFIGVTKYLKENISELEKETLL